MITRHLWHRAASLFLASYLLTACSGGSGTSANDSSTPSGAANPTTPASPTTPATPTTPEAVPTSPPLTAEQTAQLLAAFDTKTLKGTDANANGIRDEVEDALAKSAGANPKLLNAMLAQAKAYQTWFDKKPATTQDAQAMVAETLRLGRCIFQAAGSSKEGAAADAEVMFRTFTTKERSAVKKAVYAKAGAFVLPVTSLECQP